MLPGHLGKYIDWVCSIRRLLCVRKVNRHAHVHAIPRLLQGKFAGFRNISAWGYIVSVSCQVLVCSLILNLLTLGSLLTMTAPTCEYSREYYMCVCQSLSHALESFLFIKSSFIISKSVISNNASPKPTNKPSSSPKKSLFSYNLSQLVNSSLDRKPQTLLSTSSHLPIQIFFSFKTFFNVR